MRIEEGFHFSTSFTPSAPSAAARVCATRLGRLGKLFIDFFFVSEQLLDARALLHGEEINGQNFTLDFLAFCFVHPARALLNSTPQLLAREAFEGQVFHLDVNAMIE